MLNYCYINLSRVLYLRPAQCLDLMEFSSKRRPDIFFCYMLLSEG